MTTQRLPTSLPPGWESDYDGTSERWFFVHRPTGFCQFFFPKAGDENTRVAELAQPQPTNGSLMNKMASMTVSDITNTPSPDIQRAPMQPAQPNGPQQQQQQQQQQAALPVQNTSTPQPSPIVQQSLSQGIPLARTVSGSVQRKAIPRRDSVQSQTSTTSSQTAPQPVQQYQVLESQTQSPTQFTQNVQNLHQAQQGQQPQADLYTGPTQPIQSQLQPAPIYYQNQQSLQTSQPQPQQHDQTRILQSQAVLPTQTQVHQPVTQTLQYQQVQPLPLMTGQPVQNTVQQPAVQSPQVFTIPNQGVVFTQPGQAQIQQQHHPQLQQHIQQHHQQQQPTHSQIQPQYSYSPGQNQTAQQNVAANQRRFSTIPLSHHPNNGQVLNPSPQVIIQGARHSSIGTDNYHSQPLIQQMQPIQGHPGQPIQYVPVSQTQTAQHTNPVVQSSPGIQYTQQNVAPLPPSLPPPAPGMKWVLVQPGTQQPRAQPAQISNQSPQYSVQMQQFGGAQVVATDGRPGMVTRLSSSTMSSSKKALEASKGFVKKHPGKTMAIVGGLGIVAEACGVNVISDAVAGSKIYANVQNAKAKKKALNTTHTPITTSHNPTNFTPQVSHHTSNPTLSGTIPVAQYVLPQAAQQAQYVLPQQNTAATYVGQGLHMNPQQTFLPTQQAYQQSPHQQVIPSHTQQHHQHHHQHHQHHAPQVQQQLFSQQNAQPTDPSQFVQYLDTQSQNNGQQSPVQYYQPVDNLQFQGQQPDFSQQQQPPSPSASPFDPSQIQQTLISSNPPFDSSSLQQQQFSNPSPSTSPLDQSSQFPQDQIFQDQAFDPTGDPTGDQASIIDDNSYIDPPSPTLVDFDDSNSMPDDMSAIC